MTIIRVRATIVLCCLCLRMNAQAPQGKASADAEIAPIEYSRDTGMKRLDLAHLILNRINIFMGDDLSTRKIEEQLPNISHTLQVINSNMALSDVIPEFKNLQLDGVMLDDITGRLSAWRSSLFKYDKELADINDELEAFSRDSAILRLARDSLYMELFLEELRQLRQKWEQARRSTDINRTRIKTLQLVVSKQYFLTVDMKSRTSEMKRQLTEQLFRNEYGYLWNRTAGIEVPEGTRELAFRAVRMQVPLIGYFIGRNRFSYICILVIGVAIFWWLRRSDGVTAGKPINAVLYALVVMLNIHPLFELHASTLPISQMPLLVVLSILFWRTWPRKQLAYWWVMIGLYCFLLVSRTVLLQLNGGLSLLFLNALSATIGYYSLYRIKMNLKFRDLVQLALWIYLLLNVIAIGANVCGRLSLARILTTSSIIGVVQAIGLSVFTACLMESFWPQAATGEHQNSQGRSRQMPGQLKKGFMRFIGVAALTVWLMSLAVNLNVYDSMRILYRQLLYHPVKIGSFSFQLGNLILFFLILYLSNILQGVIGLIFAVDEHALGKNAKNGSRMAMLRLFVIIAGFLLAVAASGIPLDKIAIVLGALGVGIGLGLQNIVNNLVSGFILVFERPFQIGDLIELNRKRGIVRDIGIRASKIITEDGAEVIVPNGDLLSGQVINWTGRAHRIRTPISLTVEGSHGAAEIESIVQEALAHQAGVATEPKPNVLINSATERSTNITVLVWITNISELQAIKSEVINILYQRLKEKGLRIL